MGLTVRLWMDERLDIVLFDVCLISLWDLKRMIGIYGINCSFMYG